MAVSYANVCINLVFFFNTTFFLEIFYAESVFSRLKSLVNVHVITFSKRAAKKHILKFLVK